MTEDPPPRSPARRRVGAKRSAAILIGGSMLGFAMGMGKSILLARLLSVADYGIVGTFAAAMNLVQTTSNFNFQLLLVQHRSGDDADFGAAVKGLTMARQFLIAALIVALGQPLANLMGHPDLAWAYRLLALQPLLGAFRHPDLIRMKRDMRFGPEQINTLVVGAIGLVTIWPLVLWLGDYRVMLVTAILTSALGLIGSHLQAERPFRVGWNWEVARLGLRFGWPLMASGLVLFGVMQGDRVLVAQFYSAEELGLIAAVLAMVTAPVLMAISLVRSYFLPVLAPHQDDPAGFASRAVFTLQATLCSALVSALGFALAGPFVLTLAFGERYAAGGAYVALLGVAFSAQLMRSGPNIVAMARGDTLNMLFGNVVRLLFLVPAALLAARGTDLVTVLAVGATGQVVAYVAGLALLGLRSGVRFGRAMALPYGFGAACLASLAVAIWRPQTGFVVPGPAAALSALCLLATIATSRRMLRDLWRQAGLKRL